MWTPRNSTVLDRPIAPLYTPSPKDRGGEQRDGTKTQGNQAAHGAEEGSEARSKATTGDGHGERCVHAQRP